MQPQVVLSILRDAGYDQTDAMTDADVVLVNTCAIREGAHLPDRIQCAPVYNLTTKDCAKAGGATSDISGYATTLTRMRRCRAEDLGVAGQCAQHDAWWEWWEPSDAVAAPAGSRTPPGAGCPGLHGGAPQRREPASAPAPVHKPACTATQLQRGSNCNEARMRT